MSTSFPQNMSIKLVLRLKIERFEISEREKKVLFFPILITLGDPPLNRVCWSLDTLVFSILCIFP